MIHMHKRHQIREVVRYQYVDSLDCQKCRLLLKTDNSDVKSKLDFQGKKLADNNKCKVLQNKLNFQNQKVKRLQSQVDKNDMIIIDLRNQIEVSEICQECVICQEELSSNKYTKNIK
jgi:uncharacterized protein (UPF0371 family)